jgi:drug/metabolite transporter (DMT)-like permease
VVAGEFWVFDKRPSRRSLAALVLMVGGAVVAGLTDLTFNLAGYVWVSICVGSTAAYLLLIRKLQQSTGAGDRVPGSAGGGGCGLVLLWRAN